MAESPENPTPTKKRGRKPKLDPELVAAALAALDGNVAAVARRFKVARSSVVDLIGRRPALQQVARDAREGMLDTAESVLFKAVKKGEAWAVCFFLKTQGKGRGYVERQEVEDVSRVTKEIVEEIVDAPQDRPTDDPPAPGPGGVPA